MNNQNQISKYLIKSLILTGTTLAISYSPSIYSTELIPRELSISTANSFVAEALKISGPSVVTIETRRRVIAQPQSILPPGILNDPYLERLFGLQRPQYPRSRIESSQGSGVIFSAKGFVLTNAHVIDSSDRIIIGLSDGRRLDGKLIGQDLLTDLAVIRIKGDGLLPAARIGNSDKISVGDWAIAVGNPFGLEKTVTLGIISNLNRNVSQLGISDKRLNLIQTDAAINPGNSGGPLLNYKGEVIGINTLVRSGPGAGLGFAIPINKAIKIADQLVLEGQAIHPMIGVNLIYISSDVNEDLNVNKTGAKVANVVQGGPASKSGLKANDIIIKVNKIKVSHPQDVINAIENNGIEDSMVFTIRRQKKILKITIRPVNINSFRNR